MHTGEMPYVCNFCERNFSKLSFAKNHIQKLHKVLYHENDVSIEKEFLIKNETTKPIKNAKTKEKERRRTRACTYCLKKFNRLELSHHLRY